MGYGTLNSMYYVKNRIQWYGKDTQTALWVGGFSLGTNPKITLFETI